MFFFMEIAIKSLVNAMTERSLDICNLYLIVQFQLTVKRNVWSAQEKVLKNPRKHALNKTTTTMACNKEGALSNPRLR